MALAISNIPVLSGEVAERFVRSAEEGVHNRGHVDFSQVRREWQDFETANQKRIQALREAGRWPF